MKADSILVSIWNKEDLALRLFEKGTVNKYGESHVVYLNKKKALQLAAEITRICSID